MSTEANTTRELEPALRYLAAHPDKKIDFIVGKFQVEGGKAAMWAWLEKHNGGKKDLPAHRIDAALAAAPIRQAPAPKIAAIVKRRAALEHLLPGRPTVVVGSNSAPNTADYLALIDDGKSPWEDCGRRPQRRALYVYRPALEAIRDVLIDVSDHGNTFGVFKRKWLGATNPAPKKVGRFLVWCDRVFNKTPAPAPRAQVRLQVEHVAPTQEELRRALRSATPPPVSKDGWQEIEAACGGRADYYARYSGDKTKTTRLGFTKTSTQALTKRGFQIGMFVRVFWNPKIKQLGLVRAGNGFKIRSGKDSFAIAGVGLLPVLGKTAIEFVEMPAVDGYDLVLGPIGGAS